jgi:hypothetical protein
MLGSTQAALSQSKILNKPDQSPALPKAAQKTNRNRRCEPDPRSKPIIKPFETTHFGGAATHFGVVWANDVVGMKKNEVAATLGNAH